MRSIRSQLLISLAVISTVTFALAAWATYVLFRHALLQEFDALLGAKARTLAMLAEPEPGGIAFEFQEHELVDFSRAFEPEYYEAWDDKGNVLADSGHASKLPSWSPGTLDTPQCAFLTLPDGRPGRMIAIRFLPVAEEAQPSRVGADWVTLLVARDTEQMDLALHGLSWMLGGVSAMAVVAMIALLGWVVLRSLRPLDTFAAHIAQIGEAELATRLSTAGAPAEMIPVINGFNQLLERIEAAFDRERTFSSNVAHELRTPLAGLLATIQVALSRNRGSAEYRDALAKCEDISNDTHRLVETLLTLTRLERGNIQPVSLEIALDEIVDEQWKKLADRADEKGVAAAIGDCIGVNVAVDGDQLRIVLANLFDNAIEYTRPGGSIECSFRALGPGATIRIANGPCDLAARSVTRVFEQFWRGDAARSKTGAHSGLGLSLCKRIVEAAGGQIAVTLEGDFFVTTIIFKTAQSTHIASVGAFAQ